MIDNFPIPEPFPQKYFKTVNIFSANIDYSGVGITKNPDLDGLLDKTTTEYIEKIRKLENDWVWANMKRILGRNPDTHDKDTWKIAAQVTDYSKLLMYKDRFISSIKFIMSTEKKEHELLFKTTVIVENDDGFRTEFVI